MYEDGAVHSDAAREVQYFRGLARLAIHHETPHTGGNFHWLIYCHIDSGSRALSQPPKAGLDF